LTITLNKALHTHKERGNEKRTTIQKSSDPRIYANGRQEPRRDPGPRRDCNPRAQGCKDERNNSCRIPEVAEIRGLAIATTAVKQGIEKMKTITINDIISQELTVEDFTDAEILQLAYGIKFADMDSAYWYRVQRPLFLAKLESLQSVPKSLVDDASPAENRCRVCGDSGMFTTLVGSGICDDCI